MGKYFKVDAKPLVPASLQHSNANMTDAKLLADWSGFEVPRGANKLVNVNVLQKGVDGADIAVVDFEIIWAKGNPDGSAPTSLAAAGAVVGAPAVGSPPWFNLVQGKTYVDSSRGGQDGDLKFMRIASIPHLTGGSAAASGEGDNPPNAPIVLQGEPNSGSNVGYDKLYCALIAKGTSNMTTSTLNVDAIYPITVKTIVVETIDARLQFAPGDVIHDENDRLLGTVASIDSATGITFEDNLANATVEDEHLYNVHPIVLQLSFEK
jgi:hypothetical protein|tara:strand:- start:58 stop:852 length:795 start_codon:yes stop_codon:yes gene_type:complete